MYMHGGYRLILYLVMLFHSDKNIWWSSSGENMEEDHVEKFCHKGVFSGDLGGTMVLALSNALSITITIFFPLYSGQPLINVHPHRL